MNNYYITFGSGQQHEGYYILIEAESESAARAWMHENYGEKWSFSYTESAWIDGIEKARKYGYPIERELKRVSLKEGD